MEPVRTVGVEEELLVVDANGRPVPLGPGSPDGRLPPGRGRGRRGARPRRAAGEEPDAASAAHLVPELKAQQLELGTPVCHTLDGGRRANCASGAAAPKPPRPPSAHTSPPWPPHRSPWSRSPPRASATPACSTASALTAREMLTCGCHVHVSVADDDEGVAVLNRIRIWLPVLTALTANSPFWQGADSGYASFRSQAWHRWPSAGPNEVFADAAEYHRLDRRRARHRHRPRHRHGLFRRPPVGEVAHRRGPHRRRRAARRGRRHPGRRSSAAWSRPPPGTPGGHAAARRPRGASCASPPGGPAAPGSPATSSTRSPAARRRPPTSSARCWTHVRPALADAGDEQRVTDGLDARPAARHRGRPAAPRPPRDRGRPRRRRPRRRGDHRRPGPPRRRQQATG